MIDVTFEIKKHAFISVLQIRTRNFSHIERDYNRKKSHEVSLLKVNKNFT